MNRDSNKLEFLDILEILSFCISVANLDENLTQGDKQDIQKELSDKADTLLTEIHSHLKKQDIRLDAISKELKEIRDDISRNIQQAQ